MKLVKNEDGSWRSWDAIRDVHWGCVQNGIEVVRVSVEDMDLMDEINALNAKIHALEQLPNTIKTELNDRHAKAKEERREAESKIEDWETESASDANLAYWEGQCHALKTIMRKILKDEMQ